MTKKTTSILLLPLAGTLLLSGCDDTQRDIAEEQHPRVRSGIEQAHLKHWDKAIDIFQKALEENPKLARPHLELALIYHQEKKNYIYAIYHYEQYLEKRPDSEKRALIEEWIKQAQARLGVQIGRADIDVSDELVRLDRENNLLRKQLEAFENKPAPTPMVTTVKTVDETPVVVDEPEPTVIAEPVERIQTPAPHPTTYKVLPGDSLIKIARSVYGDGTKWQQIYEANKDKMSSETDLRAGQIINIPAP